MSTSTEIPPLTLTHDKFFNQADAILDLYIDHHVQKEEAADAIRMLIEARNRQFS